ncbi:Dabb family protein [Oceanidesulfovibrio marinus]|uniref:Dabb family protein n=1 Tax=Oceanidesulfovibrio marinus TaxID=370038 RepID=A0A6P1ZHN5_9BACT|nr:Dabb family protein [Oceanidesulfovibrio marinus]QJT07415.1 Dabb family protein [Oceanidesulfovibrio marinus]TVM34670.1 Dabb family protein [Oceanidesulfovibrio marinus]
MVTHIVMWKLKEENKAENAREMKKRLDAINDLIPGLKRLEVSTNILVSDPETDIALFSQFDTLEDLKTYAEHPRHLEVVAFIKSVAAERRVVDYEL